MDEALRGQLRSACEEYKKARDSEVVRIVKETNAQERFTHYSICQGCGAAESAKARFKTCSRCMSVKYCSVSCAAEHWHEAHQPVCDNLRRMRERVKDELGQAPSLRDSTDLLKDFVTAHTDHWIACQVLAFTLQHWQSPPWGGAAGAVDVQIRDVARLSRGADSLVAIILPLSTMLEAIRRDKSGDETVSAMRDSTEMLKRVDVDVGFVVLIAPEHEEDGYCAHPRVRYTLSQEQLRRLMLKAKQEGLISVDRSTMPFTAEIKTKRLIG
jgi:ribosomal protein L40E